MTLLKLDFDRAHIGDELILQLQQVVFLGFVVHGSIPSLRQLFLEIENQSPLSLHEHCR